MNFEKCKIVGGKCVGKEMWVDRDSKMIHFNGVKPITTYKTYGYFGVVEKKNIRDHHYHARIKEEFIEIIEEEPKENNNKSITLDQIISAFGHLKIFSVEDTSSRELISSEKTFAECKELINNNADSSYDYTIQMDIMTTENIKKLVPTI